MRQCCYVCCWLPMLVRVVVGVCAGSVVNVGVVARGCWCVRVAVAVRVVRVVCYGMVASMALFVWLLVPLCVSVYSFVCV